MNCLKMQQVTNCKYEPNVHPHKISSSYKIAHFCKIDNLKIEGIELRSRLRKMEKISLHAEVFEQVTLLKHAI